jgi:hypothetical protein
MLVYAAANELYITPLFSSANFIQYYRLNGNSNDWKGSANGTDTSVNYSTSYGLFYQGAQYKSASSAKTITAQPNFGAGDRTVSLWVQTTSTSANQNFIGNRNDNVTWWRMLTKDSDEIYIELGSSFPSNYTLFDSDTLTYGDGAWHNLMFVISGNQISLYADCVNKGTSTWFDLTTNSATDQMQIAASNQSGYTDFYNGNIDDVALFNRALSSSEISNVCSGNWRRLRGIGISR